MKTRIISAVIFGILVVTMEAPTSAAQVQPDPPVRNIQSVDFNLLNGVSASWSRRTAGRLMFRCSLDPSLTLSNTDSRSRAFDSGNLQTRKDRNTGITLSAIAIFRLSSDRKMVPYAGCGPMVFYKNTKTISDDFTGGIRVRSQIFESSEWGAGIRAVAGLCIPLSGKIDLFSEYHLTVHRTWAVERHGNDLMPDLGKKYTIDAWTGQLSPLKFGISVKL
jgi:hypothetical protein